MRTNPKDQTHNPERHNIMAVQIGQADDRVSFDRGASDASTVAQFATLDPDEARSVLQSRSLSELRELAEVTHRSQDWHRQGLRDGATLRTMIGAVSRNLADEVDPQTAEADKGEPKLVTSRG